MRVIEHPILGSLEARKEVELTVDGRLVKAFEGEPIAAALLAAGITTFRRTRKTGEPRGYFCGIGLCTDCMMIVDDKPNVKTCVTPVRNGMNIKTQVGLGHA